MTNKIKSEDFRYISGHFLQDGYRHYFSLILGRFGLHFGMFFLLKSEKCIQKKTAKTCLQKSHAVNPERSGNESCGPLKQFKDPQILGLLNLTKGLETLHWCLAARWRIIYHMVQASISCRVAAFLQCPLSFIGYEFPIFR